MRREATCLYETDLRCKSCQFYRRKRNSVFIIDETMVHTGCKDVWILIAIEPVHKCNSTPHLWRKKYFCSRELFILWL